MRLIAAVPLRIHCQNIAPSIRRALYPDLLHSFFELLQPNTVLSDVLVVFGNIRFVVTLWDRFSRDRRAKAQRNGIGAIVIRQPLRFNRNGLISILPLDFNWLGVPFEIDSSVTDDLWRGLWLRQRRGLLLCL